jgi:hypothetical protein
MKNIGHGNCDSCSSKKVPVLVYYHYGSPVLNQCQRCEPRGFSEGARLDKEKWLAGLD